MPITRVIHFSLIRRGTPVNMRTTLDKFQFTLQAVSLKPNREPYSLGIWIFKPRNQSCMNSSRKPAELSMFAFSQRLAELLRVLQQCLITRQKRRNWQSECSMVRELEAEGLRFGMPLNDRRSPSALKKSCLNDCPGARP